MELTINELDDLYVSNGRCGKKVSWNVPEIEGTNERAFSAQHYKPDDFLNRSQSPAQPVKREPLNYDDILLKLNVQIVNGVMRYVDHRKGFTFENAATPQVKPQANPQVNVKPLTAEEHKECRIKQDMDRRRLNQVKTTKMLIPNNNATISKPSVKAQTANAPATNGSGMFKMKMGK